MNISAAFPSPAVDIPAPRDGQPQLPVIGQIGRTHHTGTTYLQDLHLVQDSSLPQTVFSTVEEARQGAREITSAEFDAGRTGSWLRRRDPRIEAIALLSNGAGGIQLARTTGEIDDYDVQEGYIFKQWQRVEGDDLVRATDDHLLGLVSHGHWADLRDTAGAVTRTQKL